MSSLSQPTQSQALAAAIAAAIGAAIERGDLVGTIPVTIPLERPKNRDHGDYATSVALQLARLYQYHSQ
jgi:arginyl-tRNA synthetase